jgi:hypothetical protein
MKIEKKILPEYFAAVRKRIKTFEIRKDDDNIQPGDILTLREWDGEKYTGNKLTREVTYVLRDCPEYGLMDGYCVIAIQPIGWNDVYYSPSYTMVQNGDNNTQIVNGGTLNINMGGDGE